MARIVTRKVSQPKKRKKGLDLVQPKDGDAGEQSKVGQSDWRQANADWKSSAPREFGNLLEAKKA
jgi:hypothetical protein